MINDHIFSSNEYAVSHLNTPLIMVIGHSSCLPALPFAAGFFFEQIYPYDFLNR